MTGSVWPPPGVRESVVYGGYAGHVLEMLACSGVGRLVGLTVCVSVVVCMSTGTVHV